MPVWQGFTPKVTEVFGGLVTNVDRNDLGGTNVSPNCQDVEFTVGSVRSRRGTSLFKNLSGSVGAGACTAMFAGWQPSLGPFTACYFSDSTGNTPATNGYFVAIDPGGLFGVNLFGPINTYSMCGVSAFSRFWMGFPAVPVGGRYGTPFSVPRVFDFNNVAGKFYQAGLPQPIFAGATATEVASTGNTTTAGLHYIRVTFEGLDGSTSPISLPQSVTTTGGANTAIQVTNIPTGPIQTARRVLWATTVADAAVQNTQSYYTLRTSSMVVNDNTTTTATIAFTDSALTTGETALSNSLFTIMRPPPAKGVVVYKNRAFWFHLLGAVQQSYQNITTFPNTEWDADASAFVPSGLRGWSAFSSQFSVIKNASSGEGCNHLRITPDGTASFSLDSSQCSMASGPTAADIVPTFAKGKKYSIAFRARRGAIAFTQGTLNISSLVSGYTSVAAIPCVQFTQEWQDFLTEDWSGGLPLLDKFDYQTTFPQFRIGMTGTPTAGGAYVEIEPLVFYQSGSQFQGSLVLASKVFTPGTCDGATGLISVNRDDGEHIHAGFVFRDNLYLLKNRSMYVTADNGVTEPGGWTVQNVSRVCGTYSPNGVAVGDSFVIIAAADGVYLFDGGAPQKISQEINPTWARIPSSRLYTLSVTINQVDKQVVISVPFGNDTIAKQQIVLDYTEGFGDPLQSDGHGRKWTIWNTASNTASCAFFTDWGFAAQPFLMFGTTSGLLLQQSSATTTDNSSTFTSFYETAPIGSGTPGVSLIGGCIFNANGTSMDFSYTIPSGTNTPVATYALTNPMTRVTQSLLNLSYETIGVRLGGTSKWSVNSIATFVRPHPHFNIRGYNP